MRTAIILARKHGSKSMELLSGPEVPVQQQGDKFKEFCRTATHPELALVQLWDSSSGMTRERKLVSPKDAEAKAKVDAKAKASAEAKQKEAKADPKAKPATQTPPATGN